MKHPMVAKRNMRGFPAPAVLISLVVAGCVGATASGSASAWPAANLPATTAPTASPIGRPTSSSVPSRTWTSVQWTALPASGASGLAAGTSGLAAGTSFQVFGWSRGYVGFAITPPTISAGPMVVPSYSTDGTHWHNGQTLDPRAAGSQMLFAFRSVIEGATGLLAVGWSGACGSEYLDSLWTSSDGISWQPVDASKVFGASPPMIARVSGGAASYVAVAYKSAGVWTSRDGRTWQRVDLGAAAYKNSFVDDGTAVSGGFVLAGTAGTPDCSGSSADGSSRLISRTAAVWWSADGSSWRRTTLPGATANDGQSMWIARLGDHLLVALDDVWATGQRSAWGSKDGQTWTPIGFPKDVSQRDIVSDGQHNLVFQPTQDALGLDPTKLRTIDDAFDLVTVGQSGDLPQFGNSTASGSSYGLVALGPTGIVATNGDGSRLWLGKPSSGA